MCVHAAAHAQSSSGYTCVYTHCFNVCCMAELYRSSSGWHCQITSTSPTCQKWLLNMLRKQPLTLAFVWAYTCTIWSCIHIYVDIHTHVHELTHMYIPGTKCRHRCMQATLTCSSKLNLLQMARPGSISRSGLCITQISSCDLCVHNTNRCSTSLYNIWCLCISCTHTRPEPYTNFGQAPDNETYDYCPFCQSKIKSKKFEGSLQLYRYYFNLFLVFPYTSMYTAILNKSCCDLRFSPPIQGWRTMSVTIVWRPWEIWRVPWALATLALVLCCCTCYIYIGENMFKSACDFHNKPV